MLAASDDDSAMQHVQAAASETSKTSETSVPAVRPLRSALLADPAALMCRPFPPLQSWGCIPCPPQEENRCHCPPKDSCREIPDCPPPRTTALQTAGPGNLYQPALRLRQPSSALQMSSVSPSGALQRGLLQSVREF